MIDLTYRALTPIGSVINSFDFPLADYIPETELSQIFDRLYLIDPEISRDGDNVVISTVLAFEESIGFNIPGCESYSLEIGSAGTHWTALDITLVIGPDLALIIQDLNLGIRFSPSVLRKEGTDQGALLFVTADLTITPGGLQVSHPKGASLERCLVAGTDIIVEASEVLPVFGDAAEAGINWVEPGFQGVVARSVSVDIPTEYLSLDPGSHIDITLQNMAIGTTGFTGGVTIESGDLRAPVTGKLLGFPFRFRKFNLDVFENSVVSAGLGAYVRLEALEEPSKPEKWVAIDIYFFGEGETRFAASLSSVQPAGAGSESPSRLVTATFEKVLNLGVSGLRVEQKTAFWAFYLSGDLELLVDGAKWPRLEFDEIGLSSKGDILLPEGSGLTFSSPLVVQWHFIRLTVSKFHLGRPDGQPDKLRLGLSAEVMLLDGLPAGASVDGLTVTWAPGESPDVSLDGIGVAFGVPGSFNASIFVSYKKDNGVIKFVGHGNLQLHPLDMSLEIGVVVGYDNSTASNGYPFLYLFGDARLIPTGIPIASTGISIYGFQGLLAYNMRLDLNADDPTDERYYNLFIREPQIGITHPQKWRNDKGQNALGVGIIVGTADKGFSFNVKGLLVIAFPDITLLLQTKARLLTTKPDLSTESEGTFESLLVYAGDTGELTFDLNARYRMSELFDVTAHGRAYFRFSDPSQGYIEIGQNIDGKRVTAKVIYWGSGWLFNAGFWFRLNRNGIITGSKAELDLRAEVAGFFFEVYGSALSNMSLFWQPPQWEGVADLYGRVAAGFRGLSIGFELGGGVDLAIADPLKLAISVSACFRALFWKVCASHTFRWANDHHPQIESPLRLVAATPRHWTPLVKGTPNPSAGDTHPAELETGRISITKDQLIEEVPPHSVISIDFGKTMVDKTGKFNDYSPLADAYITIGGKSGWNASYQLESVDLIHEPGGTNKALNLWGTWAQETPKPNMTLRLMSSERFGHDGSLSQSFSDEIDINYCPDPKPVLTCISLDGLLPGWGYLEDGSRYHWELIWNESTFRINEGGILLELGDRLSIWPPEGTKKVNFHLKPYRKTPSVMADLKQKQNPLVQQESEDSLNDLSASFMPVIIEKPVLKDGRAIIDGETSKDYLIYEVCYLVGHAPQAPVNDTRQGTIVSENESWNVGGDQKLLQPGSRYDLIVKYFAYLRKHQGSPSLPLGNPSQVTYRFKTSGPPKTQGSLANYIAGQYPADGARAVWLGYDFLVRFYDDYVPFLYTSIKEDLVIRLIDDRGKPVVDKDGNPVIIPATRLGRVERRVSELNWERIVSRVGQCVKSEQLKYGEELKTVMGLTPPDLRPQTLYGVELVSHDGTDITSDVLFSWSFTTSQYRTFAEMVTDPEIRPARRHDTVLPSPDSLNFETVARRLGIPTINFVDRVTVSPFISLNGTNCDAIVLEAPEPTDAALRLNIEISGSSAKILPNLDETRLILLPPTGGGWQSGELTIMLKWKRDPHTVDEDRRGVTTIDPATLDSTTEFNDELISIDINTGGA